jgi:hypothetical protein
MDFWPIGIDLNVSIESLITGYEVRCYDARLVVSVAIYCVWKKAGSPDAMKLEVWTRRQRILHTERNRE